jgi:SAM-dependent methyltransferase
MNQRNFLREYLQDMPAFLALLRGIECCLFERTGPFQEPVLDIGCGDGYFASLVFNKPLCAGIDSDKKIIHEAKVRGFHQHVVAASAAEIPFPSGFFNTVISNCVLEHIIELDKALQEIHRVLRRGGHFVFTVPGHRFGEMLLGSSFLRFCRLKRLSMAYGNWFNRISLHYHTDSPDIWVKRLDDYGFRIKHWQYYLSPAGHRAFDLAHYLSVPRLISRKLSGKWVAFPNPVSNFFFEYWLRTYYEEGPSGEGPYIFFHALKD